ncbi:adenylate/guanylate cyclase domain-containing protein [Aquabacterium humicola]|uniref:adenylate/guanylate cyclase domain-containing protein n=1 Tax=Aquabacterium humicola TaxID=3237377 RepID=UPI002543AD5C|nr:adenylate/guanylate cyclase domain-containing protein [Rubrivivax pictus]
MPVDASQLAPLPWVTKTVVFADVVESVRLYAHHEDLQIARLRGLFHLLEDRVVAGHGGTVLERRGDALLAAFDDPRQAVAAAYGMHRAAADIASAGDLPQDPIWLRIGLHLADLMFESGAAYGQGLNIASRLATMASPGQVIVSEAVRDHLIEPLDGELHDLGPCHLRHLPHPVRAFRIEPAPTSLPLPADVQAPATAALPRPEPIRVRLAILPLVPADQGSVLPPLADVLLDQWIAALSSSPMLQVTSRQSSVAFKNRAMQPRAAGRHLQADFVLAGTAGIGYEAMRAQLSLIHVDSGDSVWEDEVWVHEDGIVDLTHPAVAGIAEQVVQALLVTEWQLARGRPLPNLALHTLHLAAVNQLHRFGRQEFERAHEMLQALRDRVPRHATPLAWLARWHVFRIVQGWSDDRAKDSADALEYANRALVIEPDSSLALVMAGSVQAGVQLDMDAARSYYDQALARNPSEPLAWLLKGVAHGFLGEGEQALLASERSLQLSPLDPLRYYYHSLSSAAAMGARRYERAVDLAQHAIRANCMHGSAYRTLAIAQSMLGQPAEARVTVQRLLAIEPGSNVRQFVARAAVDSAQNRRFAQALADAGLPPG